MWARGQRNRSPRDGPARPRTDGGLGTQPRWPCPDSHRGRTRGKRGPAMPRGRPRGQCGGPSWHSDLFAVKGETEGRKQRTQ